MFDEKQGRVRKEKSGGGGRGGREGGNDEMRCGEVWLLKERERERTKD